MSLADPSARKFVYGLLIVVAAGGIAGHIASASRVWEPEWTRPDDSKDKADYRGKWPAKRPRPMPTFSSNDRSRWATVRALVDEGTYVIGERDPERVAPSAVSLLAANDPLQGAALAAAGQNVRVGGDRGIIFEDGWGSVDRILNPQTFKYYSTKPPLLSTLVAGLYWLLQQLTGWTLRDNPFEVVRTLLVVINLVPFVIYLAVLAKVVERHGRTDWARLFVVAAAAFATLMTPFLITFNNHTVATCCVLFALAPVLPALRVPWERRDAVVPAPWAFALSGFFAAFVFCNELPGLAFVAALFAMLLWCAPRPTLLYFLPAALVPLAAMVATNYAASGELLDVAYSKFGGPWYEYEGSHWRRVPGQVRHGIDFAAQHESRAAYAFHVILGHHGFLSLSPIWLLALAGMAWGARRCRGDTAATTTGETADLRGVALLTLVLTVVVVGFYLVKSDNYGGWSNGLRWLMWLTPLWLLTMLPVADWLAERRWGRWLGYGLLAWSVFSVSFMPWNPWRHPWLFELLESGGYFAY
jgi:hypothetical protein